MRFRILALMALASVGVAAPTQAKEELPDISEEGLHLVSDPKLAVVYADPEADISVYDKVMLLDTYVAFKKNWKRDQNRTSSHIRVTEKDMERIKTTLSEEFNSVFAEVLEENDGYPVVSEPGEDVLLVRAAIVNLDVTAPDTMSAGRSYTFAESAGEMTLYIEVFDSVTGDMLAKGLDRKADRRSGFVTWQTSVSGTQAARRILRGWAEPLREALDEAHQHQGASGAD